MYKYVILIIILMIIMFAPKPTTFVEPPKDEVKFTIDMINKGLKKYKAVRGYYPAELEDMVEANLFRSLDELYKLIKRNSKTKKLKIYYYEYKTGKYIKKYYDSMEVKFNKNDFRYGIRKIKFEDIKDLK